MSSPALLFDTSIYIPYLRAEAYGALLDGAARSRQGSIEPRDHMHDLLILLSGARAGAVVVTENAAHFSRWASVLRKMGISSRLRTVRHGDHLD